MHFIREMHNKNKEKAEKNDKDESQKPKRSEPGQRKAVQIELGNELTK